jgi:glucose/arabinose dehydrogenase/mono/diheme cytochrome c family protein
MTDFKGLVVKLFFLLLLAGCSRMFIGCNQKSSLTQANRAQQQSFQTLIEAHLTLDSTKLGISTIVSGLDVPWEIAWGPDNWIWYTEQSGTISKANPVTGDKKVMLKIPDVYKRRSMGLLGMAIHPDFKKSPYVFVDYTYLKDSAIVSRLVRYTYTRDTLKNPLILLDHIPGANGHNGSRVAISPDGKIFMSTGDINLGKNAQDKNVLNGKILRLNMDGTIPADNPIPGSPVWSWGHRNIQGLTFTANGNFFNSEHGDVTDDEINLIRKGGNYGWPTVQGFANLSEEKAFADKLATEEPLHVWTPTIAPAGINYYASPAIPEWQHTLLMTSLKGQSLRVLKLNRAENTIIAETTYFNKVFGRMRDICVSSAGDVYISTSNKDWNPAEGFPIASDDRIIRIFKLKEGDNPVNAVALDNYSGKEILATALEEPRLAGASIYNQFCASCHKQDGNGVADAFPPLSGAQQVIGNKDELIQIVLNGLSGPIVVKGKSYDQQMPAFNFLADKELAEVLTFIRTQFGNHGEAVTENEVAEQRARRK